MNKRKIHCGKCARSLFSGCSWKGQKIKTFGQNCDFTIKSWCLDYPCLYMPLLRRDSNLNLCGPTFSLHWISTTLHPDEGMSMYRRIVPNFELCNQNECIPLDRFSIVSTNHAVSYMNSNFSSSARVRPNQYFIYVMQTVLLLLPFLSNNMNTPTTAMSYYCSLSLKNSLRLVMYCMLPFFLSPSFFWTY